jgi:hypothetical protein
VSKLPSFIKNWLGGPSGQDSGGIPGSSGDQAVLIHLDATGLPDKAYEEYDLMTLGEELTEAIQAAKVGEYDGDESGPGVTTVYLYGPDAEVLFRAVEPVLRRYPLCQNATVEIRSGGPGSPSREVRIPMIS